MGLPELLFDGDDFTLMRGLEANPFILELNFPEPRPLSGLEAAFGSVNYDIIARLYPTADGEEKLYQAQFRKETGDPALHMEIKNAPLLVRWQRLKTFNPDTSKTAVMVVGDSERRADMLAAGADDLLEFPIQPAMFRDACLRLVESGRREAPRVLIVDDDPSIRPICREVLGSAAIRSAMSPRRTPISAS